MTETRLPHVCWEGPQLVNHSLALVNREMEMALLETRRVDLSILPVGPDSFASSIHPKTSKLTRHYGRQSPFPVDVQVRHQWPPNWTPPSEGHWVVIQPWEYGSLPVEWVQQINDCVDEVWAPSTFVRTLYIQSGVDPERVHVVPNGVNSDFFRPGARPYPIPLKKRFSFLFVGGTILRKGVDILLQAYREGFTSRDDVLLVIKDMGTRSIYEGQGLSERIRLFQKDRGAPAVYYTDEDFSDREMVALYNTCDCLVHPYRGEGFGLPVLEAMSCGLPVVVTGGGATDDFVDDEVGYRIPSSRQKFGSREISGVKTVGDLWMLEPDTGALMLTMRRVVENRDEARQKGERARQTVVTNWSWRNSAERALKRINALCRRPVVRCQEKADAAVLLDVEAMSEFGCDRLRQTIESLRRNSYACLKIFLWSRTSDLRSLSFSDPHEDLEYLSQLPLSEALQSIHQQIRTPLVVVTAVPLWFSRQWLSQIAGVSKSLEAGLKIFVPSTNLAGSPGFVDYDGPSDEYSFQRFARALWRNQRGQFQEVKSGIGGILVFTDECLDLLSEPSFQNPQEWVVSLQENGCRTYWVKDTYAVNPCLFGQSVQAAGPLR
jgi:glycosyltransferase involved in cell wall biosynthesis